MTVKLPTEQNFEFLSLTGGCTDSSEYTIVKMPHCWKSHATAHISVNGQVHGLLVLIADAQKSHLNAHAEVYRA